MGGGKETENMKYSDDEKCECCNSPFVAYHDAEGIPLCEECWKDLVSEQDDE